LILVQDAQRVGARRNFRIIAPRHFSAVSIASRNRGSASLYRPAIR
jgi:hypothetical protein